MTAADLYLSDRSLQANTAVVCVFLNENCLFPWVRNSPSVKKSCKSRRKTFRRSYFSQFIWCLCPERGKTRRPASFSERRWRFFLHKLAAKKAILSTRWDLEWGSLLMRLLLRRDWAEPSSQVDKDLRSAPAKLSSSKKEPRGTKTALWQKAT